VACGAGQDARLLRLHAGSRQPSDGARTPELIVDEKNTLLFPFTAAVLNDTSRDRLLIGDMLDD